MSIIPKIRKIDLSANNQDVINKINELIDMHNNTTARYRLYKDEYEELQNK